AAGGDREQGSSGPGGGPAEISETAAAADRGRLPAARRRPRPGRRTPLRPGGTIARLPALPPGEFVYPGVLLLAQGAGRAQAHRGQLCSFALPPRKAATGRAVQGRPRLLPRAAEAGSVAGAGRQRPEAHARGPVPTAPR